MIGSTVIFFFLPLIFLEAFLKNPEGFILTPADFADIFDAVVYDISRVVEELSAVDWSTVLQ